MHYHIIRIGINSYAGKSVVPLGLLVLGFGFVINKKPSEN
ncbi:hypothetical protein SAMN04488097_0307 [Epilithonimonas lactis]|nr:hypothetical protein SAMN04488097_0307 [Epilithonimonas lactis]